MLTRTLFCLLFPFFLLAVGCKKHQTTPSPPVTGDKLQLVTGGNQKDTIGTFLPNPIAILPTVDDTPVNHGYIRFETMSCDNTAVDVDYSFNYANAIQPLNPVTFQWQLNQSIGTQTIKVILLDSVKDHLDSTTATATGIAPSSGWNTSGCIPISTNCVAFAQIPSGRIFTAVRLTGYGNRYPYYSDDEFRTLPDLLLWRSLVYCHLYADRQQRL